MGVKCHKKVIAVQEIVTSIVYAKMTYILVRSSDSDETVELPTEDDNSLCLATLTAQFPDAIGLRYESPETGAMRGLRASEGKLLPPEDGWSSRVYFCTFSKGIKRKVDQDVDAASSAKSKMSTVDLVVLGLSFSCDESTMREYFSQYGEVVRSEIKRDSHTGKSKGFGFIHFKDFDSQIQVLTKKHFIGGRLCEVKIPNEKTEGEASHRLFVGQLNPTMTEDELKEYFSEFGAIADTYFPKNPFRGFAFITFIDPNVAALISKGEHVIKNNRVMVREAAPRLSKSQAVEKKEREGYHDRNNGGRQWRRMEEDHYSGGGGYGPSPAAEGSQAAQIAAAVAAALAQAGVTSGSPHSHGGTPLLPQSGGQNRGSGPSGNYYGSNYQGGRGLLDYNVYGPNKL
ncbi:TAR DNA-binding protein 43-like isoform X1 [Artemia franciscana]|uniref:TAR DNA-binding protein 43-like isoform X1 n=2 Tax=Artemia franciscana TaxID=6661 RepID=UPI0032DB3A2D